MDHLHMLTVPAPFRLSCSVGRALIFHNHRRDVRAVAVLKLDHVVFLVVDS